MSSSDSESSGEERHGREGLSAVTAACHTLTALIVTGVMIANWVAYYKANEVCASEPLHMKTVFLLFGLMSVVAWFILVFGFMTFMLAFLLGPEKLGRFFAPVLLAATCCGMLFLCVGGVVVTVMGVMSAVDAGSGDLAGKCDSERKWFWGILIVNVLANGASHAMTKKAKEKVGIPEDAEGMDMDKMLP